MKLVKAGEGTPYEAKGHTNYWAMNKMTPETCTKRLTIGLSHFLPGGGCSVSSNPRERVYYCVYGSILVKRKSEEYVLNPGDAIYIAPGEERSFQTRGTDPASILVIMSTVD